MFGADDDLPDEYIVYIDESDRSQRSDDRIRYYQEQTQLEGEDIRLASSIGLDNAIELRGEVGRSLERNDRLIWSGWPEYQEIFELCTVLSNCIPVRSFGAFSAGQLTFLINRLRQTGSLRGFLLDQDVSYKGRPEGRDNIFKFLRACEYGLPQHFSVIELFVKQRVLGVDYSLFVGGISSWFRPQVLKEIDEEGIPIQISERFFREGDTKETLKQRLSELSSDITTQLTGFEREWTREAL